MMTVKLWIVFVLLLNSWAIKGQNQEISSDDHLAATALLSATEVEGLRSRMREGIQQYFEQQTNSSPKVREAHWNRNYQSHTAYLNSVAENRAKFKEIIGVVDERKVVNELTLIESTTQKALVAETELYRIYSVSWPVLEGVTGVGLWIEPHANVQAQIVAIPDAASTPEMLAGLSPGVAPDAQFATRLAAAGCRVIIPLLIDRGDTWSGNPDIQMTNQTHREFIYRRAYEVGRHIIGYEVQKILGAVDWFTHKNRTEQTDLPIAVAGYGEGGLIAFYSAAVDQRIDGTMVSGYFQERQEMWKEPIYRNVWGLLNEFGDAEIAGLIAPRQLVIEACEGPNVDGPPVATGNHKDVAAPGRLKTPSIESVNKEALRAKEVFQKLKVPEKLRVAVSDKGKGLPGSTTALQQLLAGIGVKADIEQSKIKPLKDQRSDFNPSDRLHSQFTELLRHLDKVIERSSKEREKFWNNADPSSLEQWVKSTESYRDYLWNELLGQMPQATQSLNPRTRLAYETPKWRGYWVELDVWPGITAGGILLIPKGLRPGEQRPVVVCQHGLGGHPEQLVDSKIKSVYNAFAAKLADQGYIVYAPQDSYGLDDFRVIQRMANPLKKSLYSVIIGQHQQALNWLKKLHFVDNERIGFYGLSYGGKTAMRVPPILKDYSVVICSGDFNEWVWKNTSLGPFFPTYMLVGQYEMFEFNLANTLNYAEMAGLIAPRPFMVERGHWDKVAPDEWVAYEYAKVRRLYARLGISDRTTIEFFDGPHEIHGVGAFEFLSKHLKFLPR